MDSEKTNQIIQALLRDYINEQVAKDMNKPHISSVGSPIIMINPDSKEYRQYVKNTDQSIANAKNTPAPYRELTKLGQKLMQIERDFRYSTYPQHIKFVGGEKAPHSGPLPGAPDRRIQGEFSGEKNMQSEYEEILKKMAEKKVSPEMAIAAPSASPQYALPQVTPLTYGQPQIGQGQIPQSVQYARPGVTPLTYGQPQIGRQPQGAMSNDPSDPVVPSVMTPAANKAEAFSDILNMMGQGQSPITIPYQAGFRPPTEHEKQINEIVNVQEEKKAYGQKPMDKSLIMPGEKRAMPVMDMSGLSEVPVQGQLTAWAEERPSAPSPWPGEGRQPQAVPETAKNMDDILAALAINLVPAIAGNLMDPGAGYNPAIGTGLAGTQFLIKGRLDEEAAAREKEALDKKLAAEAEQNKAKMEYEYKFEKFKKDLEKDSGQDAEKFQWYDPKEKLWKWGWSPKKIDFSKDAESQTKLTNIAVKPEELEKNKSVPRLIVDEVTGYKRWAMPPTGMKPGEIRSVRGGGKQSTGGQTAGGQSVVPQLTPNQKKDVDRQLPQFLRETAKQRSAYYAANQILNTINSGLAISSIPVELARAAGEVGALSKDDVNRWKGSRALLDRVEQVFKEITTGQLTEKNKQLYKEYAEILMKKNSEIINQTKKAYSESISASNKADPRAVDAILDPHVSRFIAPAKPTAEMSKEERAKEFERFKTMYGKKKE